MDASLPQPSPDDDQWVDVDTLIRMRLEMDLAMGRGSRWTAEQNEYWAASTVEHRCRTSLSLARKLGGEVDYQCRLAASDPGFEVRIRMRVPLMETVVLETTQDFIDWMDANKPMLMALAQRAKLAEAAPEVRSCSDARTRRSL